MHDPTVQFTLRHATAMHLGLAISSTKELHNCICDAKKILLERYSFPCTVRNTGTCSSIPSMRRSAILRSTL